jgi:DNA-binding NarL/FixJ family response regulator
MSEDHPPATVGLLLSDDMMFTSRITGTARDLGLTIKTARAIDGLKTLVQSERPTCVIVDLANPGLAIGDLTGWLAETRSPPPRVVAYGSHVDTETLKRAREAGCDLVLPRSKFVTELPNKLREWMGAGQD